MTNLLDANAAHRSQQAIFFALDNGGIACHVMLCKATMQQMQEMIPDSGAVATMTWIAQRHTISYRLRLCSHKLQLFSCAVARSSLLSILMHDAAHNQLPS